MKYQRHARGGRFKEQRAGDLGIRAFRDQQNQIIESIKLQRAREKEYSDQYASGLKSIGQTEVNNLKQLNTLEAKAYETRRRAVALRGKREVEALLGKAKEKGLDAEAYADFSPKLAAALGQIASAAITRHQKGQAYDQFTEDLESGKIDQIAKLEFDAANQVNEEFDRLRAEGFKNNDPEGSMYISSLKSRSNEHYQKLITQHVINNSNQFQNEFLSYLKEKGIKPNEDEVQQLFLRRGQELVFQLGLKGKNKVNMLSLWSRLGNAQYTTIKTQRLDTDTKLEQAQKLNQLGTLITDPAEAKGSVADYLEVLGRKHTIVNGKIILGYDDQKATFLQGISNAAKLKVNVESDTLRDAFLDSCTPGTSGKTCITWRQRYPKDHPQGKHNDFYELIETKLAEGFTARQQQEEKTLKGKDDEALFKFEQKLKDPEVLGENISNSTQYELVKSLFKEADVNNWPKTKKRIGTFLQLNPNKLNLTQNIDNFYTSIFSGNYAGANQAWLAIEPNNRTPEMVNSYELAKKFESIGLTPKKIKEQAKKRLVAVGGTPSLIAGLGSGSLHDSGSGLTDVLSTNFLYEAQKLHASKKYGPDQTNQLISEAWGLATRDLTETAPGEEAGLGQGLFRRLSLDEKKELGLEGEKGAIWWHGLNHYRNPTALGSKELQTLIDKSGSPTFTKDEKTGRNIPQFDPKIVNAIPQKEYIAVAQSVITGRPIRLPLIVHEMYEYYSPANDTLTKTHIMNGLLAQKGFEQRLLPGKQDLVKVTSEVFWDNEAGPMRQTSDRDAVPLITYMFTVDAAGEVPKSTWLESNNSLTNIFNDRPDLLDPIVSYSFDKLDALGHLSWNDLIQGPDPQATLNIILQNKHKYGIRVKTLPDGTYEFTRPYHNKYQTPPERKEPVLYRGD